MKTLSFEIDGRTVTGYAFVSGGTLWAHVDGETFVYEREQRSRRGGKSVKNANPGEVHAPMPGKIVKIMVKPGATVAQHDVLVVMEAMKMEYTLKAQAAGRVAAISCAPGDQVMLGQLLVKLDPA